MINDRLWKIYSDVYFGLPSYTSLNFLLTSDEYCILTACNPDGEVISPEQNQQLCNNLIRQIKSHKLSAISLLGAEKNFHHIESSMAIKMTLNQSVIWAKQFRQNAFYWVANGMLYLIPAKQTEDYAMLELGFLATRLVDKTGATFESAPVTAQLS